MGLILCSLGLFSPIIPFWSIVYISFHLIGVLSRSIEWMRYCGGSLYVRGWKDEFIVKCEWRGSELARAPSIKIRKKIQFSSLSLPLKKFQALCPLFNTVYFKEIKSLSHSMIIIYPVISWQHYIILWV